MAHEPDSETNIGGYTAYLKTSRSTPSKLAQGSRRPAQEVGRNWRFHREAVGECHEHSNRPPTNKTGEQNR